MVSSIYSRTVYQWLIWVDSTESETFPYCYTDNSGNIYLIGKTSNSSINVGTSTAYTTYNLAVNGGGFIVKLNSSGVVQWVVRIYDGTTDNIFKAGGVLSADGQYIYIAASSIFTTLNIGLNTSAATAYNNVGGGSAREIYVLKFNTSTGNLENTSAGVGFPWITVIAGTTTNRYAFECKVDSTGNVYILSTTGSASQTVKTNYSGSAFGTSTVYSISSPYNSFSSATTLLKISSNNVPSWMTWISGSTNVGTTVTESYGLCFNTAETYIYI